jgi:hypothetical protein
VIEASYEGEGSPKKNTLRSSKDVQNAIKEKLDDRNASKYGYCYE